MRSGIGRFRAPAVQIFEDTNIPPLRQARFPNRRHHSSTKTPAISTPTARWKQQTLTQLTPTLSHATSNHDSSFESHDLEYEGLEIMMPPKKRLRKSAKHTPDQKTITQMDPFRWQLYPREDVTDLEEDHMSDTKSPPRKRKRKTSSIAPNVTRVQTRSAKKRAAATKVENEQENIKETHQADAEYDGHAVDTSLQHNQRSEAMPPPKTPKTTRRKEVPSSQSPADTPWSMRSNKSKSQKATSPLKERSVNAPSRTHLSSRRKVAHVKPKLEIGDSMAVDEELEEDNGGTPFLEATRDSSAIKPGDTDPSERLVTPLTRSIPITSRAQSSTDKTPLSQKSDRKRLPRPVLKRSGTIADSLEESRESLGTDTDDSNQYLYLKIRSPIGRSIKAASSIEGLGKSQAKPTGSSDPEDKPMSFEPIPTGILSQQSQESDIPFIRRTPSLQDTSERSGSSNDQPSARRGNRLLQGSSPTSTHQAPVLETESQFEDGWREYTPPSLDYGSSQPDHHHHDEGEENLQLPQPPLPTPKRPEPISKPVRLPPVPPSQATTVDITQSTPHRPSLQQGSIGSLLQTACSQSSQRQQSQSLSSPLLDRKLADVGQDTYVGYQGWNGVRMTDSQLLPASLIDDGPELPVYADGDEDWYLAEKTL